MRNFPTTFRGFALATAVAAFLPAIAMAGPIKLAHSEGRVIC